jgi:hypothetical protein
LRRTLEKIKKYLTLLPVLRARKISWMFKLYIAAQEHVVGTTLMTQEEDGMEYVVAYVSHY